jgi:hypothetical protein
MKITIDHVGQFRNAFPNAGRGDHFTYEALELLFDYLEEIDPEMELDVIAICCDYSEDMPEEIADSYSIDVEGMDDGEILDSVTDFLENHTSIVGTTSSGSIVYASNF